MKKTEIIRATKSTSPIKQKTKAISKVIAVALIGSFLRSFDKNSLIVFSGKDLSPPKA